jgi:hypothetical protein
MSFPNVSDIIATTLEKRRGTVADNVSKNNAGFYKLKKKGNSTTVDGGRLIYEELSFAGNGNGGWYNGYDILPVGPADVLSAAEYDWKQYAVPVVASGREQRMNSGRPAIIKLIAARIKVAESTMANDMAAGLWSDGTGAGGKQLTGLVAAVPVDPTTGTYGGINRANWTFWRSYKLATGHVPDKATIQADMNTAWVNLVRGTDHPDIILADNNSYAQYLASLQAIQRFTDPDLAKLGFTTVKYQTGDVVLDGGIGGYATLNTMLFLNTDFLFLRTHEDANFEPLNPETRVPWNQDASARVLGWMGNLTCSGAQFQGRVTFA